MALKPVPKENKGLGKLPTEVRNKMGFMAVGGPVRQRITVRSDKTAGPKGYTEKTSETLYRDKSTGGKFVKDKPRKPKGMEKGGRVMSDSDRKLKKEILGESGKTISDADRARVKKMFETGKKKTKTNIQKLYSSTTGEDFQSSKVRPSDSKRLGGFAKGGEVKRGTSKQMTGKKYAGVF